MALQKNWWSVAVTIFVSLLSLPVCAESNASAGCCSVLSYGSERQSGSINDVIGSKACVRYTRK